MFELRRLLLDFLDEFLFICCPFPKMPGEIYFEFIIKLIISSFEATFWGVPCED